MKKILLTVLLLALLLSSSCTGQQKVEEIPAPMEIEVQVQEETEADFSVLKVQLNSSRSDKWLKEPGKKLEDYLEEKLEMPVQVSIARDYISTIEDMKTKKVHLAFLTPLQYVLASRDKAANPLLRALRYDRDDRGGKIDSSGPLASYKGQLLVAKNSDISSLKDLKGKKVAVVSFLSSSSYIIPSKLLSQSGLDPLEDIDWIKVASHDKAIEAIYDGKCDAAFTYSDAREIFVEKLPEIYDKVRLLSFTPSIASDLVANIPDMDEELVEKIYQALISIDDFSILKNLYDWDDLGHVVDSDYDELRIYLKNLEEGGY